jgi:membrane protease YdiL (CAAX protease family)
VGEDKRDDMALVAQLVGITGAVAWAVSYAFEPARAGQPRALVALGATYGALTALALFHAYRKGRLKAWLVPATGDLTRGFVAALVLFGCAYGFVKLITFHASPRAAWLARLYLQIGDPTPLRKHQAMVGLAIAVAALLEELVWRGWARELLEALVGERKAWLAAGVLYALAHVPTIFALADTRVGPNPVVFVGALGCGIVWSAMARFFDRLAPSVVSHALFDFAVLVMFRLWGASI